jgi:hypothetical protein
MLQVLHGRQGHSKPREGRQTETKDTWEDRYGKQCKKSVYMGKEEAWRRIG